MSCSAGVQAVVADLVKAIRQDVLHEACKEGDGADRDALAILGAEGHGLVGDVDQPAVGDGYAVGVASEVGEDVVDAGERACWHRRPSCFERGGA